MQGIYKKINNIMKKVEFVTKDGVLGFGKNTFSIVTHDKVLSVVRQHFVEEGVVVIPKQVDKAICVDGTTKSGTKKIRMEALYEVSFIDIEDGSEIIVRAEAHAEDNSDKGANKCLTYAVKNALLKVLMLQTGDDVQKELTNSITDGQFKILKSLIDTTKTDLVEFLAHYKASTLKEFSQSYYSGAIDLLQKKVKQGSKDEK